MDCAPECHIHRGVKSLQPRGLRHSSCARLGSPFGEGRNFPNIHPEPPLAQLEAVPSCPVPVPREENLTLTCFRPLVPTVLWTTHSHAVTAVTPRGKPQSLCPQVTATPIPTDLGTRAGWAGLLARFSPPGMSRCPGPRGSCHKKLSWLAGKQDPDPGAGMGPRRAPQLLLLLALGLAGASTPGPGGSTAAGDGREGTSPSSPGALSYGDVVAAAVALLNARAVSPYVLRLREAQPRPGWPSDLQGRQELSFTLEETTCRTPGTANGTCRSRWLGVVTWCQGSVFLEGQQPTVELSCEKAPATLGRIWKSKIKDFFGKVKLRFQSFFQCGRIWIRDRLNIKAPKP
uniref:Uncharacterized protein n=1 Tax=Ficedula albicollis TaxID=59894 RepID=A0A803V586_FICAL